jgi:hypothetical protein
VKKSHKKKGPLSVLFLNKKNPPPSHSTNPNSFFDDGGPLDISLADTVKKIRKKYGDNHKA